MDPGWHDVPLGDRAPYVLTIMTAGAFVAIALRRGGWRKWTSMAVLVGAMVLLPAVFYANGAMEHIELYQARYIFPLLAPTFFLMLAVDQDEDSWFTVPQAVWVTVCASLCQAITLHTLLLRFVQGVHKRWELNLDKHIEWWWSVPVSPMMGLVPHDMRRHRGCGGRHGDADACASGARGATGVVSVVSTVGGWRIGTTHPQGMRMRGTRRTLRRGTSGLLVVQQAQEVGAVPGLHQGLGALAQALVVDEAHAPGDLLGGADIEALTVLDGTDEAGGVGQ